MIQDPLIREQVMHAIQETIKDLDAISSVFTNTKYDLNKVIENELDFILGAVLSQIINRSRLYIKQRLIKTTPEEINQINEFIFSQAANLKEGIRKIIGL